MAVQTSGHQSSSRMQLTICSKNACFDGNTKAVLRKAWVSHFPVKKSVALKASWGCRLAHGLAGQCKRFSMVVQALNPDLECS